jgi:hypothetical protein
MADDLFKQHWIDQGFGSHIFLKKCPLDNKILDWPFPLSKSNFKSSKILLIGLTSEVGFLFTPRQKEILERLSKILRPSGNLFLCSETVKPPLHISFPLSINNF